MDKQWVYKGHTCVIERDEEDDCIKHFHLVTKPDGKLVFADITPYDNSQKTVEMWIDAGCPVRQGIGPLHREHLEKILLSILETNAPAGTT